MKTKVNRNTHNIFSIKRVTRKFLEVSPCSRTTAKKCTKKSAVRAIFFYLFLLIRPVVVVVFLLPFSLSSPFL